MPLALNLNILIHLQILDFTDLDSAAQYDKLKEKLGFTWWSIRKQGTELQVAFDEPAIESDVNGEYM